MIGDIGLGEWVLGEGSVTDVIVKTVTTRWSGLANTKSVVPTGWYGLSSTPVVSTVQVSWKVSDASGMIIRSNAYSVVGSTNHITIGST